jgi:hypothetical protein
MGGIPTLWGGRYEFSELPLWRKVSIVLAVGLFFFLGYTLFSKEAEIYASASEAPVAATRQVSPVRVNHGYVRYVTHETAENIGSWRQATGPSVGALALVVGALLLTYRGGDRSRVRG